MLKPEVLRRRRRPARAAPGAPATLPFVTWGNGLDAHVYSPDQFRCWKQTGTGAMHTRPRSERMVWMSRV